jgi:hypothetical protein
VPAGSFGKERLHVHAQMNGERTERAETERESQGMSSGRRVRRAGEYRFPNGPQRVGAPGLTEWNPCSGSLSPPAGPAATTLAAAFFLLVG